MHAKISNEKLKRTELIRGSREGAALAPSHFLFYGFEPVVHVGTYQD